MGGGCFVVGKMFRSESTKTLAVVLQKGVLDGVRGRHVPSPPQIWIAVGIHTRLFMLKFVSTGSSRGICWASRRRLAEDA